MSLPTPSNRQEPLASSTLLRTDSVTHRSPASGSNGPSLATSAFTASSGHPARPALDRGSQATVGTGFTWHPSSAGTQKRATKSPPQSGRGGRYSRDSFVDKEPRAGERGQQPQVVGFVLLDEFALHLLWRTDDFCFPLKCHLTATNFTEDLRPADIRILVTPEDDRGHPVAVCWGAVQGRVRSQPGPPPAPLPKLGCLIHTP